MFLSNILSQISIPTRSLTLTFSRDDLTLKTLIESEKKERNFPKELLYERNKIVVQLSNHFPVSSSSSKVA